jgi:hypothetical protein
MKATCIILTFIIAMLKGKKKWVKSILIIYLFNYIYIKNYITSICNQYTKPLRKYFISFSFFSQDFEVWSVFRLIVHPTGLAIFQVLNGFMWLLATILDSNSFKQEKAFHVKP